MFTGKKIFKLFIPIVNEFPDHPFFILGGFDRLMLRFSMGFNLDSSSKLFSIENLKLSLHKIFFTSFYNHMCPK
ncbi:Uncharacterised protein [Sphingobacterium multivorum]|uniref:Uncharacterized protein n=1 Tax=Sphingobacterium multivorum TaxID=28454 RepID=A0A2X2J2P3_SPHMU|nr:Uncharacterised protein [Sphingobacterium multivorum]